MQYTRANAVLPRELVALIQDYIDGECIYIPRKAENKKAWGESTGTKQELSKRNIDIYEDFLCGIPENQLAERYFLSEKSIQRIITAMRKNK
ncbi:MAG TPA: hypothetical protein GX401_01040 [Clostridiales bacterium]|nr:hypothetical protein [Clostridiales bacterium]